MIKYEFLDVGLAYRPRHKCGGSAAAAFNPLSLIGSGVSALGGVTSSLIGANSASRNNETSLAYASMENERQRQWTEQMYRQQHLDQLSDTQNLRSLDNKEWSRRFQLQLDSAREMTKWIYENFDSPQAKLQALQKAGLNPAMILGSVGSGFTAPTPSMPSPSVNPSTLPTPSGMSSSMMSPPRLENEGVALSQGIESTTRAIANLASAGKDTEDARRLAMTHQIYVDTMLSEKVSKQYAARSAELHYQLDSLNLPTKQKLELKRMMIEINNATFQGELSQAQTLYTDMMTKLSDISLKKGSIELDFFRTNLELQQNDLKATIAMKKAQEVDLRASASQHRASAANLNAQTQTENAIRQWKVDLEHMNSLIAKSENTIKQASVQAEIEMLANRAVASGLANKETQERIQVLIKEKNWYELNKLLNGLGAGAVVGALVK